MARGQSSILSPFEREQIHRTHIDCIGYDIVRDGIVYRAVSGWPRYRVGDDGTAWGVRKFRQESLRDYRCWRQLSPGRHTGGYLQVHFYDNYNRVPKFVHRLVLETFVGPCPEGMEACHNDGDRSNNRMDNLRWDTRTNNHADKLIHGTMSRGSSSGRSKLHELVIPAIRALDSMGIDQWKIAEAFGVEQTLISGITRRKIWRHVKEEEQCDPVMRQILIDFSSN